MSFFEGYFTEKLDCKQFKEFNILLLKRCCHPKDINSTLKMKNKTFDRYKSYKCDVQWLKETINTFNSIDEKKYKNHNHYMNICSIADSNKIPIKAPNSWKALKKRKKKVIPSFGEFIDMLEYKCSEIDIDKARAQWIFYAFYIDCYFNKPRRIIDNKIWRKLQAELDQKDFALVSKWYIKHEDCFILTIPKMNIKEILNLVKILYPFYHEK